MRKLRKIKLSYKKQLTNSDKKTLPLQDPNDAKRGRKITKRTSSKNKNPLQTRNFPFSISSDGSGNDIVAGR